MAAIIQLLTVHVATVDMRKGILPGTAKLEITHKFSQTACQIMMKVCNRSSYEIQLFLPNRLSDNDEILYQVFNFFQTTCQIMTKVCIRSSGEIQLFLPNRLSDHDEFCFRSSAGIQLFFPNRLSDHDEILYQVFRLDTIISPKPLVRS